MNNLISEFSVETIAADAFGNLNMLTSAYISTKIADIPHKIDKIGRPIHMSIGQNCACGVRLKSARAETFGSTFFDNVVVSPESISRLLLHEFSNQLMLKNLQISTWEGHDSVYDQYWGIFYHHYFVPNLKNQKSKEVNGRIVRRIDETDIPLFLSKVRGQFEYLSEKYLAVLRSKAVKFYYIRSVSGSRVNDGVLENIRDAMNKIGGQNFSLVAIESFGSPGAVNCYLSQIQRYCIPVSGQRWGETDDWINMLNKIEGAPRY